ncbi:cell division protein [Candidatus Photodesmus blepharus]|uniref:Cell division protein FtsA n=1 Tax=Candidatus Photodesmus blepharonis TaxID=1179155 RepID=A0A084CMV1_9GAMM|nr:cell division protein FtsA [Candidatus Photodesmus blepharus]KEY91130.1 cell division protein [Candidatus Photodesmus blepharus]
MSKPSSDNVIVALDIGTANVSALLGEVLPDGQINVLGAGTTPSRGMKKGGVNDLESVVRSIQRAVDKAELMAEYQISDVFLSLSDSHIASRIEKGMGTISDQEVSQEDMDRAIHTAKSIKIGNEQRILHVIPQEFTIDSQDGIRNPLGLSGFRIEVSVHLISCHSAMARNIIKAVESCGLKVDQLVYSGLAASNAVITDDERELGVCVVDIGAGTMDVSIWTGGFFRHTEVFSYAGNAVTSDIAFAFGMSLSSAEEVKIKYGCAMSEMIRKGDTINVPSIGGRVCSLERQTLSEVIEARYTELMGLVNQTIDVVQSKLRDDGVKHYLSAGVVFTGGASQIDGLAECAERVFRNQVRVCKPLKVATSTDCVKEPYHSTVVGLLHYAKDNQVSEDVGCSAFKPQFVLNFFGRLRSWIKKEF